MSLEKLEAADAPANLDALERVVSAMELLELVYTEQNGTTPEIIMAVSRKWDGEADRRVDIMPGDAARARAALDELKRWSRL